MDHAQPGSPVPPTKGGFSFFRTLASALLSGRSRSRDSFELLGEHEQSLRRLFPEGAPSGDGSAQFDQLVETRHKELEWQLTFRRRILTTGLIGAIIWLAIGAALFLDRFAS
jgi:hypothetical protein